MAVPSLPRSTGDASLEHEVMKSQPVTIGARFMSFCCMICPASACYVSPGSMNLLFYPPVLCTQTDLDHAI